MPADPEIYPLPIDELHVVRPNFKILVFNEKFKYLGETEFHDFEVDSYRAFVGKDGLYLSMNNEYHKNYNEDYMYFNVIRFDFISNEI